MRQILKKIRKIEIKTKKLVDGLLQGNYHSVFKGRGIEFSQIREYVIGDDIRSIDWNVTARMNKPFVKEFIEERDLTVYIVFDASASSNFGSTVAKKEAAIELSASLCFAAMNNNDNVGLVLFTEGIERCFPARKGKKHVLKLIREMLAFQPMHRGTDIEKTMIALSNIAKKRSIIFLISDFMTGDFSKSIQIMRTKHDIIAININDQNEMDLPDVGYIELEDEETGEVMLVNTSDRDFRNNYNRLINDRYSRIVSKFRKVGIDMIRLRADEGFEMPIKRFFKMRERRMVR